MPKTIDECLLEAFEERFADTYHASCPETFSTETIKLAVDKWLRDLRHYATNAEYEVFTKILRELTESNKKESE
jgi:hypothetical protein